MVGISSIFKVWVEVYINSNVLLPNVLSLFVRKRFRAFFIFYPFNSFGGGVVNTKKSMESFID